MINKAGEMLQVSEPFLEKQIHPTVVIRGFFKALEDATNFLDQFAVKLDPNSRADMLKVVRSCLSTKFVNRWGDLMCNLALDAVQTVSLEKNGRREVDIKRYAKVEKVYSVNCVAMQRVSNLRADPRRRNWGKLCPQRSHVEQRRHSPQDASSHWEPSHYPLGLPSWVQEGWVPDILRYHQRDRFHCLVETGGGLRTKNLQWHYQIQARPRYHREGCFRYFLLPFFLLLFSLVFLSLPEWSND